MKTGLSMEGGAMRGMFTCGVIDVFLEQGILFDGAAGISAGAVFGCNFKSKQIGRALRYNLNYGRDWRYCSLRSFLTTGDLYGADFCYRVLPDELDIFDREAFRANPMAFYVGATDIVESRIVYHECRDGEAHDLAWMRASASMPVVSKPVEIDGKLLLDGGITEAVPVFEMRRRGYTHNVVILTQPEGYRKTQSKAAPAFRLLLRNYPKTAEAMVRRHERYNEQLEEIERLSKSGSLLAIYPPGPLGIRRTENDPEELKRVYRIGRETAMEKLDVIREYLTASEY